MRSEQEKEFRCEEERKRRREEEEKMKNMRSGSPSAKKSSRGFGFWSRGFGTQGLWTRSFWTRDEPVVTRSLVAASVVQT